jgi:hypothetical protein
MEHNLVNLHYRGRIIFKKNKSIYSLNLKRAAHLYYSISLLYNDQILSTLNEGKTTLEKCNL